MAFYWDYRRRKKALNRRTRELNQNGWQSLLASPKRRRWWHL